MKKFLALSFCAIICMMAGLSCMHGNENGHTSFTVNESDHYFYMRANFSKDKTRNVEKYMDNRIGKSSNMSFINSEIDGTIALDDHTKFYLKKYPGYLE